MKRLKIRNKMPLIAQKARRADLLVAVGKADPKGQRSPRYAYTKHRCQIWRRQNI